MTMLILNADQLLELHALNASGSPHRRLEPVTLPDGRHVLNADLLMDLDPGETWWHYRILLLDLPAEAITRFSEASMT